MDSWDLVLLVVAGYLGTTALVRLMIGRRDELVTAAARKRDGRGRHEKATKKTEQQTAGGRTKAA